jgi:DNA-binding response OmpR family regulator
MSIKNQLVLDSEILRGVHILVVDNNLDSGDLYAELFESYGAKVTKIDSIKVALAFLDWFVPDIVVCETIFLGESVYPLIERVRSIEECSKTIPILVTSTFSVINFAQYLMIEVEAYLCKPVDIYELLNEVCKLILIKDYYSFSIGGWSKLNIDKTSSYLASIN